MKSPYAVVLDAGQVRRNWPCESEIVATARVAALLIKYPDASVHEEVAIDRETSVVLRKFTVTP